MNDWSQPTEVEPETAKYIIGDLAPLPYEIPNAYRDKQTWLDFADVVMGNREVDILARSNIDVDKAIRHISYIAASFSIEDYRKRIAIAWLASLWFTGWIEGSESERESP